jgi:hypothetical protein
MAAFASMNFLRKTDFKRAVQTGLPVVVYSPVQTMPAINGPARVEGPWPGTKPPVDEVTAYSGGQRIKKPRERVTSWHADVVVRDMRIVEVH